jgi:hypothetical protein
MSGHASVTKGGAFLGSDGLRNVYKNAVARIAIDRNATLKRVFSEATSALNAIVTVCGRLSVYKCKRTRENDHGMQACTHRVGARHHLR